MAIPVAKVLLITGLACQEGSHRYHPQTAAIVEVTLVDESILRLRLKHNLSFMSFGTVYAPTEVCETEEMFYIKFDSVLEQCPRRGALIFPGDFNAVTGTERGGYEICAGPPRLWYLKL